MTETDHHENSETSAASSSIGIEMPASTAWPILFALGLTLLFAGLVTHAIVSVVGCLLAIWAARGLWFDVLPDEDHVSVPLQPEIERPPAIIPRTDSIERLDGYGELDGRHRASLPAEIHPYSSGLRGGIAGGLVMALTALVYGLIAEGSIWYPINLLASSILPSMNLADADALRSFSGLAFGLGCIAHVSLSLFVGWVYAALLPTLPGRNLLWGGVVAPVAWSAVVWVSLGIVAPALNEHIDWKWFIASQVAFGLVTGYVISRIEPVATIQSAPFAARAGVEATGMPAHPQGDD